jgi:hypothetical protein
LTSPEDSARAARPPTLSVLRFKRQLRVGQTISHCNRSRGNSRWLLPRWIRLFALERACAVPSYPETSFSEVVKASDCQPQRSEAERDLGKRGRAFRLRQCRIAKEAGDLSRLRGSANKRSAESCMAKQLGHQSNSRSSYYVVSRSAGLGWQRSIGFAANTLIDARPKPPRPTLESAPGTTGLAGG